MINKRNLLKIINLHILIQLTFLTEKSSKFGSGAITDRPIVGGDANPFIFAGIAVGASVDSAGSNSL